ncbi:MAG TPA: formyltransferase family protein [Streptosporangiaceae bacterium]|nr:formyltransferase family protein [Streptosporangiaceae bacterium]
MLADTGLKIAVLASGSGTILASIIEHGPPVAVVVSDRPCQALEVAARAGIPAIMISRRDFGYRAGAGEGWDRQGFTQAVSDTLRQYDVELIAMAGFFTILHEKIFERYENRILNTHPALLPAFRGAHAVRDTLAAGVSTTGPTIHLATATLDDERGIIARCPDVPVLPDDDEATLWERIKVEERRLYPKVLWGIVEGEINLGK